MQKEVNSRLIKPIKAQVSNNQNSHDNINKIRDKFKNEYKNIENLIHKINNIQKENENKNMNNESIVKNSIILTVERYLSNRKTYLGQSEKDILSNTI